MHTHFNSLDARTRDAVEADLGFAWMLYEQSVRPLMEPHLHLARKSAWDENAEKDAFLSIWDLKKVLMITVEDNPIGWLSIDSSENTIRIENIYLLEKFRGHGLGTTLLNWLISIHPDRPFILSLIEGCRSESLYNRLGFVEQKEIGFEKIFIRPN
ncbi:GNAT family N-acetyltransferase [Rhizobium sp. 9T]|uniref:GNAT family N-acetyltransferase n=1 Tax=Rhizobium croatiense TaxID=2867516 RepID=UPI001C933385|nr:GNAT family N-acetyltransferase [Rhizobium croatiense]MBY4606370.1 GNAT family N-acetyltransferase [Rhizobium croatiense]